MFKKFRIVFVRSSQSKDDLQEKSPDPSKPEKGKNKSKLLGLFRSASDQDLHTESKSKRSLLRRKKKPIKEPEHEVPNGIVNDTVPSNSHPEISLPNNLLPDNTLPVSALPNNLLPDNTLPVSALPENLLPDNTILANSLPAYQEEDDIKVKNNVLLNDQGETELQDSIHLVNRDVRNELLEKELPLKTFDSPPTILPHPVQVEEILSDPLPPDDKAWKRAKEVWEKNETEETKEKKKKKKEKEKKEHSDRKKEREERKEEREGKKEGRKEERERSRSKDKEHGAGRSESRSKERKKDEKDHKHHDKHKKTTEHRHEEKRGKDDKTKHKSKSDKHTHKHGGEELDIGHDGNQEDNNNLEKHHKHSHKHSEKHHKNKEETHTHHHEEKHKNTDEKHKSNDEKHKSNDEKHKSNDEKHKSNDEKHKSNDEKHKSNDEKHKSNDEKHTRKHREKHHKHSTEDAKKCGEPKPDKNEKIELDKVWREYESGKRYYSAEKDMKKVIDRLDGVERYRREERQRSTDRSHGFSSDTSCDVEHRSRSKESRRRSRSREKHKHESDQEANPSQTWQYSLGRIEARQEQCKADIDIARRSIEHRIKQLEMKLEKQYSSSEKLPEITPEKPEANEAQDFRKIIDKVADECREVTRTLEVRTEEMKTEIASVVREEFENLDERLSYREKCSGSPTSFYRMQLLDNLQCDEFPQEFSSTPTKPTKPTNDVTSVTSMEHRLSSADESMVTVIEENSRAAICSSNHCVTDQSQSLSTSRDSPVRVSQSGALDTQSESAVPQGSSDPTIDPQIPLEHPDSPLQARSQAFENLYQLSIESLENEDLLEEDEGPMAVETPESLQMMYRRRMRETEERCQERAVAEKDILYKRINELESMVLSARSSKGNYV